jgi:hypothetical protein
VVEPWPLFLIGSGILVLSGIILSAGMKFYLMTQRIIFTSALVGSVILIVVLATGSNADFIVSFNQLMGPILEVDEPYQAIIASGKENGWAWDGTTDWEQTWLVSNWPFLPLVGAAFSIAIGGEVNRRRGEIGRALPDLWHAGRGLRSHPSLGHHDLAGHQRVRL